MSPEQLSAADYGEEMSGQSCVEAAEKFIRSTLRDPYSAQFTRGTPCVKGYMKQSLFKGGKTSFGYIQNGAVNAKNAYGGYVGYRPYTAIVRNGVVVEYCVTEPEYGICE